MLIKKDTWHFKLAKFGGLNPGYWHETKEYRYSSTLTSCEYAKSMFDGLVKLIGALFAITVCSIVFVAIPVDTLIDLYNGSGLTQEAKIGVAIIVFEVFVAALIGWMVFKDSDHYYRLAHKIDKLLDRQEKPKAPGFFKTMYTAWKDKVCVKVEIE